mgnify:CR=1 FL=1|tara:strand:+ start:330 stop:590 length:261 start_codon:yes stop_codon:yes gene_type:complete
MDISDLIHTNLFLYDGRAALPFIDKFNIDNNYEPFDSFRFEPILKEESYIDYEPWWDSIQFETDEKAFTCYQSSDESESDFYEYED